MEETANSWWVVLEHYKTSGTKCTDSLELEPQSQKSYEEATAITSSRSVCLYHGNGQLIQLAEEQFCHLFYSSNASDSLGLRESIASGMCHSMAEAKKTYDRR